MTQGGVRLLAANTPNGPTTAPRAVHRRGHRAVGDVTVPPAPPTAPGSGVGVAVTVGSAVGVGSTLGCASVLTGTAQSASTAKVMVAAPLPIGTRYSCRGCRRTTETVVTD